MPIYTAMETIFSSGGSLEVMNPCELAIEQGNFLIWLSSTFPKALACAAVAKCEIKKA